MSKVKIVPSKEKILEQKKDLLSELNALESEKNEIQFMASEKDHQINRALLRLRKLEYLEKEFLDLKEASELLGLTEADLTYKAYNSQINFYSYGTDELHFRKAELEYWVFSGNYLDMEGFKSEVQCFLNIPLY
jgi:hypothetical protein